LRINEEVTKLELSARLNSDFLQFLINLILSKSYRSQWYLLFLLCGF